LSGKTYLRNDVFYVEWDTELCSLSLNPPHSTVVICPVNLYFLFSATVVYIVQSCLRDEELAVYDGQKSSLQTIKYHSLETGVQYFDGAMSCCKKVVVKHIFTMLYHAKSLQNVMRIFASVFYHVVYYRGVVLMCSDQLLVSGAFASNIS